MLKVLVFTLDCVLHTSSIYESGLSLKKKGFALAMLVLLMSIAVSLGGLYAQSGLKNYGRCIIYGWVGG